MTKKHSSFLQILTDYFTDYLPLVKGLSANTITSYQYTFALLFEFMFETKKLTPEKVTFESLSGGLIADYLNWLENKRNCSAKTRNQRRTAISSFAKYAMRKNFCESLVFYTEVNNIPKKKVSKQQDIKFFTKEEMAILLNLPDTTYPIGQRDTVLLSVLYASGARAQEICDLAVQDIRFGKSTTVRLIGKGNKSRIVVIPDNCAKILADYLKSIGLYGATGDMRLRHVFSSQTHEHMTISCVEEITKKYVKKAKDLHPHLFPRHNYSPHSLRHSIAVHMLESGVPLPVIKVFLGHESILTTMVYATVSSELANKYLSGRNMLLDSVKIDKKPIPTDFSLPFLKKFNTKTTF